MIGIRGAICADGNSREAIYAATQRLLQTIVNRNGLARDEIVAVLFTMTPDLDADFPAYAARDMGWTGVPMLGAQETPVPDGYDRAIRVLLFVERAGPARHVYLGRAAAMRPDLTEPGDETGWNGPADEQPEGEARKPGTGPRLLVVGLGLIGGSLAMAARSSGRYAVVAGYDLYDEAARAALERGLVDRRAESLPAGLASADLVVLATPASEIVELLSRVGEHARPGTVVTDVGSSKRRIVDAMDGLSPELRAVGGHPMTGDTASGSAAARGDLFRGARWALVPTRRSDPAAVALVEDLVRGVGARPFHVSPDGHDRMVAMSSHVPALLATALCMAAGRWGGEAADEAFLYGPGFRGSTRLAAGDPAMTGQMIALNGDYVGAALDVLVEDVRELRQMLPDADRLYQHLRRARRARGHLLTD